MPTVDVRTSTSDLYVEVENRGTVSSTDLYAEALGFSTISATDAYVESPDAGRLISTSALYVETEQIRSIAESDLYAEVFVYVAPVYCPPLPEYQQAAYLIKLYDITGKLVAIFDNYKNLQITHILNSFSTHIFSIDDTNVSRQLFNLDYLFEVNRKVFGDTWYREYIGFHRTNQRQITEGRHRIFTSYGRGLLDLLHRREILYPAKTPFTLKYGSGEHVIKEFVDENAGPGAANPLRYVSGGIGLGLEADLNRGLYWSGQRSSQNLLETIKAISDITSVDFDILWLGGQNFIFRCYYPQRGTDQRDTMLFSPELGNMITPSYTLSRTEEATICVVLGEGQSRNRRFIVRQGSTIYDSPWNKIEITKDARNDSLYASYVSAGDEALAAAMPKETFTFEVVQTAASRYGKDYFMGDIVTVKFDDIIRIKKIVGADIQLVDGKEVIRLEFSDLPEK